MRFSKLSARCKILGANRSLRLRIVGELGAEGKEPEQNDDRNSVTPRTVN